MSLWLACLIQIILSHYGNKNLLFLSERAILASIDAITVAYIPQSIFSVLTFHMFDMFHQTPSMQAHTLKLETSQLTHKVDAEGRRSKESILAKLKLKQAL